MSVIQLTEEKLASMTEGQLKSLVLMFPEHKDTVEAYKASRYQHIIDFSNQESFDLADGSVVSLAILEMIAYSSLGGRKADENSTEHGLVKSEAWDILHAVQTGKKLQGESYELTPDGFRSRVA